MKVENGGYTLPRNTVCLLHTLLVSSELPLLFVCPKLGTPFILVTEIQNNSPQFNQYYVFES